MVTNVYNDMRRALRESGYSYGDCIRKGKDPKHLERMLNLLSMYGTATIEHSNILRHIETYMNGGQEDGYRYTR